MLMLYVAVLDLNGYTLYLPVLVFDLYGYCTNGKLSSSILSTLFWLAFSQFQSKPPNLFSIQLYKEVG
jgi:hypothetical protein